MSKVQVQCLSHSIESPGQTDCSRHRVFWIMEFPISIILPTDCCRKDWTRRLMYTRGLPSRIWQDCFCAFSMLLESYTFVSFQDRCIFLREQRFECISSDFRQRWTSPNWQHFLWIWSSKHSIIDKSQEDIQELCSTIYFVLQSTVS